MKSQRIRRAALLAALLCLNPSLAACSSSSNIEEEDPIDATAQTEDVYAGLAPLMVDGDTDYVVIRGDNAEKDEIDAAISVRRALEEITGHAVDISTDWKKNEKFRHEIIIGKTEREQTENHPINRIKLGREGYVINVANEKIYISGGSAAATVEAVELFIEDYIKVYKDNLVLASDFQILESQPFDIEKLYINEKDATDYKIFYSGLKKTKEAAELLQSELGAKMGIEFSIERNADPDSVVNEGAFILSDRAADQDGTVQVEVSNDSLIFRSATTGGVYDSVKAFVDTYLEGKKGSYNFGSEFKYIDIGAYIVVEYPE